MKIITQELKETQERAIWDKWLAFYTSMEEPVSFDDYLEQHKPKKKLSVSDKRRIIERAENIQRRL